MMKGNPSHLAPVGPPDQSIGVIMTDVEMYLLFKSGTMCTHCVGTSLGQGEASWSRLLHYTVTAVEGALVKWIYSQLYRYRWTWCNSYNFWKFHFWMDALCSCAVWLLRPIAKQKPYYLLSLTETPLDETPSLLLTTSSSTTCSRQGMWRALIDIIV